METSWKHTTVLLNEAVDALFNNPDIEPGKFSDEVPKTMKWKLRAKVGDRVQWYQLPEEVGH